MSAPEDIEDRKAFMAWFEIQGSVMEGKQLNRKDMEEIARLLDLGRAPDFALRFVADLIRANYYNTKLVPKKNGREVRKEETMISKFGVWRQITAAMAAGMTKTDAIEATMPGRLVQGFRDFEAGKRFAVCFAKVCAECPGFLEWAMDQRGLSLTEWMRAPKPKDVAELRASLDRAAAYQKELTAKLEKSRPGSSP
jgi:hypothetical protein